MGSLLRKINSGLLHQVCLWVAIAEIGTNAIMSRWPLSLSHDGLQSTSVYNCRQSNSSSWVRALILQAINALCDKKFAHMRLFSMCTVATANGSWILCQVTNKHLAYYRHPCRRSCTRVNFVWNLTHMSFWLFGSQISKLGKFLLKLRTDHSEKFASREISLLYGTHVKWNCNNYFNKL